MGSIRLIATFGLALFLLPACDDGGTRDADPAGEGEGEGEGEGSLEGEGEGPLEGEGEDPVEGEGEGPAEGEGEGPAEGEGEDPVFHPDAGEECLDASECGGGLRCLAFRCSPACDADTACPDDSVCLLAGDEESCIFSCIEDDECPEEAVSGCVPLSPDMWVCLFSQGSGAPGAPCGDDAECVSLICLGGQCAERCDQGAAENVCGSGRACVDFRGQGRCWPSCHVHDDCDRDYFCAPVGSGPLRCLQRGELGRGEECEFWDECADGLCFGAECVDECRRDGTCRDDDHECVHYNTASYCVLPGDGRLGQSCQAHDDCETGACVVSACREVCGGGGECEEDELCSHTGFADVCMFDCGRELDCGRGEYCGWLGNGPACLPRGEAAGGDACLSDLDCDSGHCVDGGCLSPCGDGGCDEGSTCINVLGERVCFARGELRNGEDCLFGSDCSGGVCLAGECSNACENSRTCDRGSACVEVRGVRACTPACRNDRDCAEVAVCRSAETVDGEEVQTCQPRGRRGPGEACDADEQCFSTVCFGGLCSTTCEDDEDCDNRPCVDSGDGGRCSPECRDDDDCIESHYCGRTQSESDRGCLLRGEARIGADCAADGDCETGRCAVGICREVCSRRVRCGLRETCAHLVDDNLRGSCVAECDGETPCPEGNHCDLDDGACLPGEGPDPGEGEGEGEDEDDG